MNQIGLRRANDSSYSNRLRDDMWPRVSSCRPWMMDCAGRLNVLRERVPWAGDEHLPAALDLIRSEGEHEAWDPARGRPNDVQDRDWDLVGNHAGIRNLTGQ
jgi:hypothetical protein